MESINLSLVVTYLCSIAYVCTRLEPVNVTLKIFILYPNEIFIF